ncbi:MAG: DNA translocase FtsK 4TM domain-containing protein [Hyphomicrobiales bacterium]
MARPAPVDTDEAVVPAAMRRFFRNRTREMLGLGLIAAAALIVVALATWSVNDPSLSYAVDRAPSNVLGYPGAVVADILMQATGLGVVFLVVPMIAWACRWLSHAVITTPLSRFSAWVVAVVLLAGMVSCFPVPSTWALPTGLGGVIGDITTVPVVFPLKMLVGSAIAHIVAFLLFAVFGLWALYHACALERDEVGAMGQIFGERVADFTTRVRGTAAHIFMFATARVSEKVSGAREMRPKSKSKDELPSFIRRNKLWSADEAEVAEKQDDFRDPEMRREPVLEGSMLPPPAPAPATAPALATPSAVPASSVDDMPAIDLETGELIELEDGPEARPAPSRRPVQRQSARKPGRFELPPMELLSEPSRVNRVGDFSEEALNENARLLEGVLEDFGVRGEIINVRPGPVVTLYELEPAPGIKSSRVIGLADDIARSMSAISARVAVVPGRNAIGIELPNAKRETVFLRELLDSQHFSKSKHALNIAVGKNIGGEPIFADLARMPHLLIAGTTGSGKSVGINTMILSLLYRLPPDKCKLIMIDPKMLELSVYEGIPHLLAPVVTDPKKAVVSLKWAVREMEDRYRKMSKVGVRNVDGFNQRVGEAVKKGEVLTRTIQTGYDPETGEPVYEQEEMSLEPMPYIVVIIDEMADLMMVAGKDIEGAVQRLAQMARAAGIHVVMATQRPSVDVITGTIKANFPTRISFQVTSKIDSRTILGEMGAEQLLGMGDMLYMAGGGRISRLHGAFVSDDEVEQIVKHLKAQGAPEYVQAVTEDLEGGDDDLSGMLPEGSGDELYDKAVAVVIRDKKASTSYIQRRLQIGYNRAATLIEKMEDEGVIGPANHAGKRDILVGGADETIPDQDF